MVGRRHAAAELARRGREEVRSRSLGGRGEVLPLADVGADPRVVPRLGEEEVLPEGPMPSRIGVHPEAVAVAAEEREHLLRRERGVPPPRRGPERRRHPQLPGQPLERDQVPRLVVQLVLQLDREDLLRNAPAVQGRRQLRPPLAHQVEVAAVVGAVRDRRRLDAVGEPAVAHLRVDPRPDAEHDVEPGLAAEVHEGREVEVAVEARPAALGHVVQPRHVGRDDGDAARPRLPDALGPAVTRNAAVVDLPRHRDPRDAVPPQ